MRQPSIPTSTVHAERAGEQSLTPDDRPVVLHVIYSLEHGGTERFLCRLLHRWAHSPVRHVVCTLREAGPRAAELPHDIEVIPLDLRRRDRLGSVKLARVVRAQHAGIVHARNWPCWTDALLATRLTPGVRVLLGFHGLQCASSFTLGQRLRARVLGMHRRRFTAVSRAAAATLVAQLGVSTPQIDVLTNGVDLDEFAPVTTAARANARRYWGITDDAFVIGNVGNFFAPVKGQDGLITAFATVAERCPAAQLLLVGFGPRRSMLEEQVRRLGLVGRVRFTGAVEHSADVMAALDLYVCPSLAEGLSNALLEAMASALPCVSTAVSDHPRLLADFDADAIVPPGDARALARAILVFQEHAGRRGALAANGRRRVEGAYSFDQTQADYASLYARLLRNEARRVKGKPIGEDAVPCHL